MRIPPHMRQLYTLLRQKEVLMRKSRIKLLMWGGLLLGVAAASGICLSATPEITFTIDPGRFGATVPERFLGLSFEPIDVIRDPDIRLNRPEVFGIGNCLHNYMSLLQPGHIRIGGLLGDSPRNASAKDPTHIGPLLEFARDIDWIVDWTLRFVPYEPEAAVPIVDYLLEHGADLLRYVGIGTEPENYVGQLRRPEGWGMTEHCEEFGGYVEVLRRAFPDLAIYGPNMVGDSANMCSADGWIRTFARSHASQLDALAVHLYPLSWHDLPTGDLKSSLRDLLSIETRTDTLRVIHDAVDLGRTLRLPVYVSETNAGPDAAQGTPSFGYFNKAGSALNMLDNLFLMAESGVQGAAIHVGGRTWWHMAPVQMGDWGQGRYPCVIRPLAYALLLFSVSDPQHFVHCHSDQTRANVHCHAFLNRDGQLNVLLINKDVDHGFNVAVDLGVAFSSAVTLTLGGTWWDAEATLGGSQIKSTGKWEPTWGVLEPAGGKLSLTVDAATAVLIVIE